MAKADTKSEIMEKPLPVILDELKDYIKQVESMVTVAQEAADRAGVHAEEARLAGEKAAENAASEMLDLVKSIGDKARQALGTAEEARLRAENAGKEAAKIAQAHADEAIEKFRGLQGEYDVLKRDVLKLTLAVNKAFVKANEVYLESAPYLKE